MIFRDITNRKNMELERNRLITELQESLSKVKKLSGMPNLRFMQENPR